MNSSIMRTAPVPENRNCYKVNPLQAGMYFQSLLTQQDAQPGYDIEQIVVSLNEKFIESKLQWAIDLVLKKYAGLRCGFHIDSSDASTMGDLYLAVEDGLSVPLESHTLPATSPAEQEAEFRKFLEKDRKRIFDLSKPPLMRCTVVKDRNQTPVQLVWTVHHIVVDGRSMAIMTDELFQLLYGREEADYVASFPATDSYLEYLDWLEKQDHKEGIEFFAGVLEGKSTSTPAPLAEPAGRPLNASGSGQHRHVLSEELSQNIQKLARKGKTTVGTVVQAMWSILLCRYTSSDDVIFGNTLAGRRNYPGKIAKSVGFFINTIPVRTQAPKEKTVQSLLTEIHKQSLGNRKFESTPAMDIGVAAGFNHGEALFDTLVMYEIANPHQQLVATGSDFWADHSVDILEQPAVPLVLSAFNGENFELHFLYDKLRFTLDSIKRIDASCEQIFLQMCSGLDRPIGEIDVLPKAEREKILKQWNDTNASFNEHYCIHQLFEERAAMQPDAVAVQDQHSSLGYRELDEKANQLANLLISKGVQPGEYVGICLSRNINLVVALIAVEKAGAAYLPMDSSYPADRLEVMIEDTAAKLVVTEAQYSDLFNIEKIELDGAEQDEWGQADVTKPVVDHDPLRECYTIFTSGSTGRPKGVVLSHRAVVNTLEWVNKTFAMVPTDRLLFVTSPCFDLSVYDVFGMLGAGGTVVVASEELLEDPTRLAKFVVDAEITVWDSAPAALQRIVPFFPDGKHPHLRIAMLSGDWIPLTLPTAMKERFPAIKVRSLGGATEAAIWSNWYPVETMDERWVSIPYGRPIDNARYHVLDDRLEPVPVGVPGDLYIGGVCLANGYLGREELTRERFIEDPFNPGTSERLYKTGDLARYFPDGNLEFLGRSDFQVKIRGYRVEMGEVEAAITHLPGVRVAVCMAFADASGQNILVAYVVPKEDATLNEPDIKSLLASKLPSFMVPSRVISLEALPITSNGKLDRSKLPNPHTIQRSKESIELPKTDEEKQIAEIWQEVLGCENVDVNDSFFEIGGHSMLAVVLVTKIRTKLGVNIPLTQILSNTSIRQQAKLLGGEIDAESRHALQAFNANGSRVPLILIPGLAGTAFTYRSLPAALGSEQPLYSIDLLAAANQSHLLDSIETLADFYVDEIIQSCGDQTVVVGGFSFGALIAFEVARRLVLKGVSVPLLISFDGFAPGFPSVLPLPERIISHLREFANRSFKDKIRYVIQRIRRKIKYRKDIKAIEKLNTAVAPVNDNVEEHVERITKSQYKALNAYKAAPGKAEFELLLVRATEDRQWVGLNSFDSMYGWKKFIAGTMTLVTVPSDHLGILDDEHSELLAKTLKRSLDIVNHACQSDT